MDTAKSENFQAWQHQKYTFIAALDFARNVMYRDTDFLAGDI